MDTSKVRISLPKSFTGEGETIEVSLALKVWFESLSSWARAHRCHPLLRGDGDTYDAKYPLKIADRAPDTSYLDEKYVVSEEILAQPGQAAVLAVKEVIDAGTGDIKVKGVKAVAEVLASPYVEAVHAYVFEESERRKGHAKGRKELADYEHKVSILQEANELKKVQMADALFACIQSSTSGKAGKIVSSCMDIDTLTRCSQVIETLEARFNIRSIRELPALEARFSLPMPQNVDPEVFIREKLLLREMMSVLEGDGLVPMHTSDAHLIVKICNWVPSAYAAVVDQIQNLILARGITSEERVESFDAESAASRALDAKLADDGASRISHGSYSGENTVTITLVTKLLREKFVDLVRRNAFKPATDEAVRAYLSTGRVTTRESRESRTCHHCGKQGHLVAACNSKKAEEAAAAAKVFAVTEVTDDPLAAIFAANFSGTCRLCGDGSKHGFDVCPIVLAGREVCGKPKPLIKPLPTNAKKVGGMNGMVASIVVCNARSVTTGTPHPTHLFMDDNGAGANIVRDGSILRGLRPIDATCVGVGTARVTHVGSFIGEGVCLDGSRQPVRLKTV